MNGWPQVPLSDVLEERREAASYSQVVGDQIPIVEKVSFDDGRIHIREGYDTSTGMIFVRPGDLLVSGINAAKGAIAIHDLTKLGVIAATIHYGAYRVNIEKADIKFLWWMLRSRFFRFLLAEYVPGGIKTELRAKRLLPIPVPLPPLREQRLIVSRIEELASKVHEARLLRVQAMEATQALMAAELGSVFRKLAVCYPSYPLGDLASHIIDGPHQTPNYLPDNNGIPFVTVKNMVTGRLYLSNLKYISVSDHQDFSKRCRAERGDVLYSKDGATRGRPCYVDTDEEFNFFVSVALIKPLRTRLDGHFLVHLLNSSWIRDRMADKSRGDMIPHIVLREIRAFPVPLPPLDEQRRIVGELNNLNSMSERVKELHAETEIELAAILPAILDKAFRGQL